MNLLIADKKSVVTNAQEIEKVNSFYEENKQYAWLASSLTLPISDDHNMSFVYGQKISCSYKKSGDKVCLKQK